MPEEPLASRYLRLSKEVEEKCNQKIEQLTKKIMGQLNKSIETELDKMENALKSGDIAKAYYHKLRAEILSSSVLP